MSRLPGHERDNGGYERLVEAVGDGVYALDADGQFVEINESLVEMSGYDRSEILDDGPWLWHDEADIYRFEDAIRRLLTEDDTTVQTVEASMETADGERLPIEVTLTLLPMEDGHYAGHAGVIRDITTRRRRNQELEKYETIVRAMPDEVYTLDEDGHFTSVIPAAGAATLTSGYSPGELIGEHVSVVMDETDVETGRELIRDLVETDGRERASFEMHVITKDGERIPHENHLALIHTDDGDFRGTVGVLRDISDRKAREQALQRQNERLEEFADVVSHDLRNPLNVASATLSLLRDDYNDERLDQLASAHDRMGRIIEDVLELTREGAVVDGSRPVSLRKIASHAWWAVESEEAQIGVTDDVVLRADPDRISRLLENLFRNAIEHASEDVTVTLGPLPSDHGEAGFFVEDNGPGIPPDERDDVFESGYTSSASGTGLGLAIVERIADAHGWDVSVTEGERGGARFEFTGVPPA